MWVSSLLTSSAASLGRVVLVGFIPNAIPAVFVVLLVKAESFSGASKFKGLLGDLRPDALSVLLFVLAVALLTVLLQPFQLRVLRVLEGYWDSWAVTAMIAPFFVEFQRRRREKLLRILNEHAPARPTGSLAELVRITQTPSRPTAGTLPRSPGDAGGGHHGDPPLAHRSRQHPQDGRNVCRRKVRAGHTQLLAAVVPLLPARVRGRAGIREGCARCRSEPVCQLLRRDRPRCGGAAR
jgi:hypothetical protein